MNPLRSLWLPRWCWGLLALLVVGLLPGEAAGPPPAERPAAKVEQRVFPLRYVAVEDVVRTLRELLGDAIGPKGAIRISGDEKANQLIVRAEAGLQVRIFWLVSGPVRGKAPGLPDELAGMAAELKGLGMKPTLATLVAITTAPDFRFENTSTVQLAGPCNLSVSGTAAIKKNKVELTLTVGVKQGSRQSASLRTQVSVVPNRPVLLGVTSTEKLTSAFVVSVTGAKAEGLVEKKAGIFKPIDRDKLVWRDELSDLTIRIPDRTMRITSITSDPLPQSAKSKFVARVTIKGEFRASRRALDQLVALLSKESRYSPQAPRVEGKRFTLVVYAAGLP